VTLRGAASLPVRVCRSATSVADGTGPAWSGEQMRGLAAGDTKICVERCKADPVSLLLVGRVSEVIIEMRLKARKHHHPRHQRRKRHERSDGHQRKMRQGPLDESLSVDLDYPRHRIEKVKI